MTILSVIVPTGTSTIDRGSALVADLDGRESGRVLVYFEGDRHGTAPSFYDKLRHASDRLLTSYPTVACHAMQVGGESPQGKVVGSFDPDWGRIDVHDRAALASWLEVDEGALEVAFGTPPPPLRAERGAPDYFERLSGRLLGSAPLSSQELNDMVTNPHRLTPEALALLTAASKSN